MLCCHAWVVRWNRFGAGRRGEGRGESQVVSTPRFDVREQLEMRVGWFWKLISQYCGVPAGLDRICARRVGDQQGWRFCFLSVELKADSLVETLTTLSPGKTLTTSCGESYMSSQSAVGKASKVEGKSLPNSAPVGGGGGLGWVESWKTNWTILTPLCWWNGCERWRHTRRTVSVGGPERHQTPLFLPLPLLLHIVSLCRHRGSKALSVPRCSGGGDSIVRWMWGSIAEPRLAEALQQGDAPTRSQHGINSILN